MSSAAVASLEVGTAAWHRIFCVYVIYIYIPLGMIATLVFLFIVHGRQREDEREKRLQYWREQVRDFIRLWKRALGLTICLLAECLPPKYLAYARDSSQLLIRYRRKCISAVCLRYCVGGHQYPNVTACRLRTKGFWATPLCQRGN
jgi:hypothetical protein